MVVGELTSYLRCGFLQTFIRIRRLNMVFEIIATNISNGGGKKLKQNVRENLVK